MKKNNESLDEKIGRGLQKARKIAKLSQDEMTQILHCDQAVISRIERGKQAPSIHQLMTLSNFFGFELDSLLEGKINYFKVAEKFGKPLPIKKRYTQDPKSTIRNLLPIIKFIDKAKGHKKREQILLQLGFEGIFLIDPNTPININLKLDILRIILKENILSNYSFNDLIDMTRETDVHGELHQIYSKQTDSLKLIQSYILNQDYYGQDFTYEMTQESPKSLKVKITPNSHLSKTDYKDGILKDTLSRYQKELLKNFPLYINKDPFSLEEEACHLDQESHIYHLHL